jgi:hypothetical protein
MGRARYTSRQLHCHNCDRKWWGTVYALDTHMRELHALDPHNPCSRCELVHGTGTICKFLPETCTCSTPHIEVLSDPYRAGSRFAQVRAEQRSAYYRMPDGSISIPSSNSFDDPIALDAVASGGVREEAYHVADLRRLQREQRRTDNDDFTDRSLVIDYDQPTILSGDTFLHDQLKEEDRQREVVNERAARGRVIFGGGYYEQARAAYERRRQ